LTATTYHGLVGAARLLQTSPTQTTGPAGEKSPGPMIDQFFAANTWLTSLMAGVGVLLIAYLIIKAIFTSSSDGNRKATGGIVRGLLLALLLFVPSLIGKIADLGFLAITSLADWLFNLVH
jgi:hypothetical protein